MSYQQEQAVEILSDDDPFLSPPLHPKKKKKKKRSKTGKENQDFFPSSTLVILDDDPTPNKSLSQNPSSFVPPETPLSLFFNSDFSFRKRTAKPNLSSPNDNTANASLPEDNNNNNFSGNSGLICVESDNESESGNERKSLKDYENVAARFGMHSLLQVDQYKPMDGEWSSRHEFRQVCSDNKEENVILEKVHDPIKQKDASVNVNTGKNHKEEAMAKKRKMKEERIRVAEERKLKREQEKLQKKALKAEAAEMKKLQKEQQKWEKGKFCLNSIVAEIDSKVVELGSVGGHLLTRFAEKGLNFRISSNPIGRSILWTMTVPEQISQLSAKGTVIPYVLLVLEADEFCDLVSNGSLMDHVSGVRSRYPSYTICYLVNKLMSYINKREQAHYKNPSNSGHWKRPPVEEVLSKLTTDFVKVHSRHCRDEAELADHIVGLTSSLANCQFRKKLTRLLISANGAIIPKDFIDKNLIKKNVWLKALIAIPKVQPRFAVAIWKKYPTMRSLLSVYMDPSKSAHEKEFLLKDLPTEDLLGKEDRRVGEICSKRVYRILTAKNGNIKTDDVENGADFFRY